MRITNSFIQTQFLAAVSQLQSNLAQTQNQVALGKSFTTPSQNPIAAGNVNSYNVALAQSQQFDRNANIAQNRLGLEDNALSQYQSALQSIRDLALQANNSTQTDQNRSAIAAQVQQIRDTLLSIANSQDGNGEYLFSGFSSKTQPFNLTATGATYAGDQGQRQIQIAAGRTIADGDNGSVVFAQLKTGNGVFQATAGAANTGTGALGATTVADATAYDGGTYAINFTAPNTYEVRDSSNALVTSGTYVSGQTIAFKGLQITLTGQPAANDTFSVARSANQDIFTTVQNLLNTLRSGTATPAAGAALNNSIGDAINNIDQALQQSSDVRASVGARLNAIDAQSSLGGNQQLQLKTLISNLQDLDYATALTTLNQQLTSLSAAQQSYTLTQGLSLFKYL
jgi:flagellar hook-associated protein 3 FlgL